MGWNRSQVLGNYTNVRHTTAGLNVAEPGFNKYIVSWSNLRSFTHSDSSIV